MTWNVIVKNSLAEKLSCFCIRAILSMKNGFKKMKMYKNIKRRNIIGTIIITLVVLVGPTWFSHKRPQTVFQYASSLLGHGKPDANAASRVVLLGDSLIALEDWNVLFEISYIKNAGVSGNTTDDILARLSQAISSKPQKLFLMVGINDLLNGQDVSHALTNYETILNRIRSESPDTMIYVQSVLPINNDMLETTTVTAQDIIELNRGLELSADKNRAAFIDLYPFFCGSDNKMYRKYVRDGLHPNSYGYVVWKNLIAQYIK